MTKQPLMKLIRDSKLFSWNRRAVYTPLYWVTMHKACVSSKYSNKAHQADKNTQGNVVLYLLIQSYIHLNVTDVST